MYILLFIRIWIAAKIIPILVLTDENLEALRRQEIQINELSNGCYRYWSIECFFGRNPLDNNYLRNDIYDDILRNQNAQECMDRLFANREDFLNCMPEPLYKQYWIYF